MGLLSKGLVAKTAAKRPDIFVHPHVNHQIVRFGKGLATHFPILKDPVAGFIVADSLIDVGHVVGLDLVEAGIATVIVAHLGHHGATATFDSCRLGSRLSGLSCVGVGHHGDHVGIAGRGTCQAVEAER